MSPNRILLFAPFVLAACAGGQNVLYTEDELYYSSEPLLRYNPRPVENHFDGHAADPEESVWYDETTAEAMRPIFRNRLLQTQSGDSTAVAEAPTGFTPSLSNAQLGVGLGLGMGYYPGLYRPYYGGYYPYGLRGSGSGGIAPNMYYVNTRQPAAVTPAPYRPDPAQLPVFDKGRPNNGNSNGTGGSYRTRENGAPPPAWYNNSSRMGGHPRSGAGGKVYGVPRR
jgi:hypothetical protein